MPLLEGLKVAPSSIHGYGVIATRHFAAGEVVLYGDGVLFFEDDDFDDEYALIVPNIGPGGEELDKSYYWDLACQSRWINHSCSPNTEVDVELSTEKDHVTAWWTALRDIRAGEELAYDYAFSGHLAVPCNCATESCLGLIVDPDELDLVPEEMRHHLRKSSRRLRTA